MSSTVRPFHCRPILAGSLSKMATMSKPALPEAAVLHQRAADLPRPDHRDPIAPLEAEDLAQPVGQLGHRIAQAALAERAEEREVLPHLGRRRPAPGGERARADRRDALPLELLEKAEVERQPADRGLGDLTHDGHFCETFHKATARAHPPSTSARSSADEVPPAQHVSGRAAGVDARRARAPPRPAPRPSR